MEGETNEMTETTATEAAPETAASDPIQDGLDAVFGGEENGANIAQAAEDQAQADELAEAALTNDTKETVEGEAGDKPAAAPAPVQKEATATLPPALMQAARRAGMEATEAEALFTANPELATRTFERFQAAQNDLSQRYAALGQQRMQPAAQPGAAQQQQAAPVNPFDQLYTDEGLSKFAENNGTDIVEKVLKPLKPYIDRVNVLAADLERRERQALVSEIGNVFKGWEGDYADVYGKGSTLTPEQRQTRQQVGTLADQIMAGAALQGMNLSVPEALEQAHNVFTAGRAKEQARKQVTAQVVKRGNGLTMRPTQRRASTTVADGGKPTMEGAMAAYAAKAAELGIDVD